MKLNFFATVQISINQGFGIIMYWDKVNTFITHNQGFYLLSETHQKGLPKKYIAYNFHQLIYACMSIVWLSKRV